MCVRVCVLCVCMCVCVSLAVAFCECCACSDERVYWPLHLEKYIFEPAAQPLKVFVRLNVVPASGEGDGQIEEQTCYAAFSSVCLINDCLINDWLINNWLINDCLIDSCLINSVCLIDEVFVLSSMSHRHSVSLVVWCTYQWLSHRRSVCFIDWLYLQAMREIDRKFQGLVKVSRRTKTVAENT